MICTFFGHRDAPNGLKDILKKTVLELIEKKDVKLFYVGNQGRYDFLVQQVLNETVSMHSGVRYFIVLTSLNEKPMLGESVPTIFPEEMEKALPRFAIFKRNEWMIQNSDTVIAYVRYSSSNAFKWMQRAEKKGLKVINLAERLSDSTPQVPCV